MLIAPALKKLETIFEIDQSRYIKEHSFQLLVEERSVEAKAFEMSRSQ